jgi:hypothetical protein
MSGEVALMERVKGTRTMFENKVKNEGLYGMNSRDKKVIFLTVYSVHGPIFCENLIQKW